MTYDPDPNLQRSNDRADYIADHGPHPMRSPYGCSDQTCGAADCKTCHPENFNDKNEYLDDEQD